MALTPSSGSSSNAARKGKYSAITVTKSSGGTSEISRSQGMRCARVFSRGFVWDKFIGSALPDRAGVPGRRRADMYHIRFARSGQGKMEMRVVLHIPDTVNGERAEKLRITRAGLCGRGNLVSGYGSRAGPLRAPTRPCSAPPPDGFRRQGHSRAAAEREKENTEGRSQTCPFDLPLRPSIIHGT